MIIYNDSLGLINEKDVGTLVGQPAIYNIDTDNNLGIIFNANVSSASYLMAYEYNNDFTKQCNVTISNGLSGAGIKCADIGTTKSCFFKDQKNVFYNFNMSSCTQKASLATNDKEDTKPTVPSILDYDNDGKMEGLWWFNNDSDNFMGIAVIELENMQFDTGFNQIGFIDDVIDGSTYFTYTSGYENVKGNPVFYQSNNAGGYEILIAWDNERYFHGFSLHTCFRSNLKLFDTDGTLLWKNTPATDIGTQLGAAAGSSGAGYGTYSDPRTLVMNIIRITLGFLGTLFLALIVYAGFLWMTAGGAEENLEKAKKLIFRSVIGLIIILSAYAITWAVFKIALNYEDSPLGPGVKVQPTYYKY